ncbi:hypothetical protein D9M71_170580 [compost metagenome]
MQGVAGGAEAVAVARHLCDHASGRIARRQGEARDAGGQSRADDHRDARQRHAVADVQVAADADAANVLGQADAIDVDVIDVAEAVRGGGDGAAQCPQPCTGIRAGSSQAATVEICLRQDFRGLAVVHAEGAIQPLGRPLGHDTPVTAAVRLGVMAATDVGQRAVWASQPRTAGVAEEEGLGAEAHQVRAAVIGAGFRQTRRVPREEVLGGNGQFRIDRVGRGNLLARDEQLLGLGARGSRQLGQVQARLAVADRVHRVENGLAPEHVVLAGLDVDLRFVADLGAPEREGIEDLAGRTAVVALGVIAQVRTAEARIGGAGLADDSREVTIAVDERVGAGAGVLVGPVVPGGGADTHALVAAVDHVQFGQQVDTVGDVGARLAEVVVAIVVVRRPQHALVGALGTHAVVVLDGVVEAHRPVGVARIDFEGLHARRAERRQDRRCQQATVQVVRVLVLLSHALAPLLVVVGYCKGHGSWRTALPVSDRGCG